MPLVKVLTKSFIGNSIREEGEVIEYEGKLGSNLELVKPASKAKAKGEKPEAAVSEEQAGE
ncbi:hypothetical protein [Pseudomonas sp.]|uniref:hypothetical protein n=1 Tax=Pseudomonas sp. TaxID=306 RepID=UPI00258CD06F|nr:hypothetical protein [Pseudomonas sp.]